MKTGRPSPSHGVQVMLYMIYAVPRAMGQYHGVTFDGKIAYGDHGVDIPASAVDETFIKKTGRWRRSYSSTDRTTTAGCPRRVTR